MDERLQPLLEGLDVQRVVPVDDRPGPDGSVPATGPCWVWRIEGERTAWIKAYGSDRAFRQERDALRGWGLERVPAVLAEVPRGLLLRDVPGRHEAPLEAWSAAGRFLRRLQSGPVEDDPMPLDEALGRRFESWRRQAEGHVDSVPAFDPRPFAGVRRARAHRDFQPRNWLWDSSAGLHVIDFEHARADHPLVDLVRLLDVVEEDDPRFGALVEAWGGEVDTAQLRGLRVLHGLGSVAWGARHGDAAFLEMGRRILVGSSGVGGP